MKLKLLFILALFCVGFTFGQWTQIGNDINGVAAFDRFADSEQLAISDDGTIVAVSAPENDSNGSRSGIVRVYKNSNNVWLQIGNDIKGASSNARFGKSIDISSDGTIIAVGEPGNNNIKVYQNVNDTWVQLGQNTSDISTPVGIGEEVTLNADGTIMATTISDNILIYTLSNATWSLNLIPLDGTRNFLKTASLAFNDAGTVLVVGNRQYNGNNDGTEDGRLLVYENIAGTWTQKGTSIISNNNDSYFGDAVDISADGNIIVVGSPHTEVNGKAQAGFVRTYKFENNDWVQLGTDITGQVANINVGRSVSFNNDGTVLAIGSDGGSRGIAQIFKFENNDWSQVSSTIIGQASGDAFGSSIAINGTGNIVAVGASDNDNNGNNSGNVRVFKNDNDFPATTNIPDANFEQYLIDENIDSDGVVNGLVLNSDIEGVTLLSMINKNISDLTGIENFTSLTLLNANNNSISSINLSNNTLLEHLYLNQNNLSNINVSNNVNLKTLRLVDNNLTAIDLSNNAKLTSLYIVRNQLSTIDVTSLIELETLLLSSNNLTTLDITKNTKLKSLDVSGNQLNIIDLSNNINLIQVSANNIGMSSIDVTMLSDLEKLFVEINDLTSIDVSSNLKLKTLSISSNDIEKLDLSVNTALEQFFANGNKLIYLNIRNQNNTIITDFETRGNNSLLCIEVWDPAYSTANWRDIDAQTSFNTDCPEYTKIPNANFEAHLESLNVGNGIANDKLVNTDLIKVLTTLDISNKSISDLTGIQDFEGLLELDAANNSLTSLDISNNKNLEKLVLTQNQLSSIDLSENSNLKEVNVADNQLTSLNIASNINLEFINFNNNSVGSIDFSSNTKLTSIYANNTSLQSIDISLLSDLEVLQLSNNVLSSLNIDNNLKLKSLDLHTNQFSNLTIDNNIALEILNCNNNLLTSLNVSKNVSLVSLECAQNQLIYLDLSKNTGLTKLICNDNSLTGLNLKNGNNTNISNSDFKATGNSNLECIQVDDKNYSDSNWTQIDMQTQFNINCPELIAVPDTNFEAYLESINAGNGTVGDGFVDKALVEVITDLNIDQKNISDITGIQAFTALTKLSAKNNSISTADLSSNTLLEEIYFSDNQLTSINLSANVNLKTINLDRNQLQNIDVNTLLNLEGFSIQENQLSQLNVSTNTKLMALLLFKNQLKTIDLSSNSALLIIDLDNNKLTSVNLKNGNNTAITAFSATENPNLTCIEVDDVTFFQSNTSFSLDSHTQFFTNCPSLTTIADANFESYLESINVGNGVVGDNLVRTDLIETLTTLNIESKNITDLTGIQDFVNLVELNAKNNMISQIDISQNNKLEILLIANNNLSNIDFSQNISLKSIDVGENNLTFIGVNQLVNLEVLSCYKNQLTTINLISNKNLQSFVANDNSLKYVDIRENTALFWLDLENNALEDLMLKNGNNTKITQFNISGNPNLSCVEVDDVNFSNTNWTAKDATANYSLDCAPANDDCSKAIPLNFGQNTPGDVNSGSANNNPSCASGNVVSDVWFSVQVPSTGEFSIEGNTPVGTLRFAIYTSCQSVSPIACGTSISLTNLTVGTTFYLKVWIENASSRSENNLNSGTFNLTARESSVLSTENSTISNNNIVVFPNPATNVITIKNNNVEPMSTVEIYSLLGKRVFFKQVGEKESITVNLSRLNTGIYFVKTKINNQYITKKLIIN